MSKVRLCRIQVKNLFGNINYDMDLGENNPIAIITAPNGRGKTTILNLVSFMFNPASDTFSFINTVPFDEFRCVLSNGKSLELKRVQNDFEIQIPMTEERVSRHARAYFDRIDFVFSVCDGASDRNNTVIFSKAYNETFGIDSSEYIDYPYSRRQITDRKRLEYIWKKQRQLLEETECSIPVNFIKADRIQPVVMVSLRRMRDYDEPRQESPLKIASEKIRRSIMRATEEYGDAVSRAKDKLPQMFLDGEGGRLDYAEFMDGWSVYRKELNEFQKSVSLRQQMILQQGKISPRCMEKKELS